MSEEVEGQLHEVLPKSGLVYSEKGNLSEVLCKPKIMPIKSASLEKLEQMEAKAKAATTPAARSALPQISDEPSKALTPLR